MFPKVGDLIKIAKYALPSSVRYTNAKEMIEAKGVFLRAFDQINVSYHISMNSVGIVFDTSRMPADKTLRGLSPSFAPVSGIVVLFEGTKQCVISEHWCEVVA